MFCCKRCSLNAGVVALAKMRNTGHGAAEVLQGSVARHGTQIFRHACRGVSDTACRVDTRVALPTRLHHQTLKKTLGVNYVTGRNPAARRSADSVGAMVDACDEEES